MATRKRSPHVLRLSGTARALESVIPATPGAQSDSIDAQPVIASEFHSGSHSAQPLVFARAFVKGSTRLKFKFPRNTPPGVYKGTVRLGGAEHEFEADVAARPHAALAPARLFFRAAAGGRAPASLLASNMGNEAFDVPTTLGVGLFAEHGVEAALGAAYRDSKEGGLQRWAMVADKLAEAHGGLVRVQVTEGAGPLRPDEARTLKLSLRFPDNLRAGLFYTGGLRLLNAECSIEVQVASQEVR